MLIEYKKANIYQSDSLVLEDVCFEVEPEQFVYVIGKVTNFIQITSSS